MKRKNYVVSSVDHSVKKIYQQRFNSFERVQKEKLWKIFCSDFLQGFIDKKDTVVDLGAGSGEFINSIRAKKKIAIDLSDELKESAKPDVEVIISSAKNVKKVLLNRKVDVFFMSNLLEHLDSKEDVFRLLEECYQVLRTGGKILIMQPDISRVGFSYWDFFDHKVAITEKSLREALGAVGFKTKYVRSPFLPYSTKTKYIPTSPLLLKLYLKLRPVHFIFGKQFFVMAVK